MLSETQTPYLENQGDARIPDDVEPQFSDKVPKDSDQDRLVFISEVQADYLSIFSPGAHSADELRLALEVAKLDLAQGVLSTADFIALEKTYETQAAFEHFIDLVEEKNSSIEIQVVLDSAKQSHAAGLLSDAQMQSIQARAQSRKSFIVFLNRKDDFSDDGRYGKQS